MPSRRAVIAGLSATGVAALAGCNGVTRRDTTTTPPRSTSNGSTPSTGTSSSPSSSSSTSSVPPPSPSAGQFEASLVRPATADHPARVAATLSNVGDAPFTVTGDYGLPFTASNVQQVDGGGSIYLFPASKPATTYVSLQDAANGGPKGTTTREKGCWRLHGSVATAAIALFHTIQPGDSLQVAYDVFVYGDGPCPANGRYRTSDDVTVHGGTHDAGESAQWHYGVTITFSGGDVSAVTASDVTGQGGGT